MPDVVVVGGGIIGAACAFELAVRGASVTPLEREELAAGASGRNNGLWVTPPDPLLLPMARISLARYLEIGDTSPVPFRLDREPIGLFAAALDEEELRSGDEAHEPYRAAGVRVDRLEPADVLRLEPSIASHVLGGWLVHHGHRLVPAALTVALALMATDRGATVRHHLPARALLVDGERVTGVVTDEGLMEADEVVVAAGPWSTSLLDPVGVRLRLTGARGWVVRLDPPSGLLRHLVASAGWEEKTGRWEDGAVRAGTLEKASATTSTLLHPASDGSLIAGSSRQPVITPEAEEPGVPAAIVATLTLAWQVVSCTPSYGLLHRSHIERRDVRKRHSVLDGVELDDPNRLRLLDVRLPPSRLDIPRDPVLLRGEPPKRDSVKLGTTVAWPRVRNVETVRRSRVDFPRPESEEIRLIVARDDFPTT